MARNGLARLPTMPPAPLERGLAQRL